MLILPDVPFLYGFNPHKLIPVHNLVVTGRLKSSDFVGVTDPGMSQTHREIGDLTLKELEECDFESVVSPRMVELLMKPALYESGQTIVNGYDQPVEVASGTKRRAIDGREVELAFEKGRREHAPFAPSRLSCLYVVPDTAEGRAAILKMLGSKVRIVEVRVLVARALFEADAGWYVDYCNFPKEQYIESYWRGEPHPKDSTIEVLVDGAIQMASQTQRDELKSFAFENNLWKPVTPGRDG